MQVPEPWQRNWVSVSHTVVADGGRRRWWLENGVRKWFLLPEGVY